MAVNEEQITLWKELIKIYLGKACLKRCKSIICDLLCVAGGIKPSLLFDYAMTELETMKTFLTAALVKGLLPVKTAAEMGIIQAGEDLLIVNVLRVAELLEHFVPIIIDVTDCPDNPRIVDQTQSRVIINEIKKAVTIPNFDSSTENEIFIYRISDNLNFSTLFGFLLGYPAVYWFDTNIEKANCLGMQPLCVFTMTAQCVMTQTHTVYSYSVPDMIVHDLKENINKWESHLKCAVQDFPFLSSVQFSRTTVTLPAVNL